LSRHAQSSKPEVNSSYMEGLFGSFFMLRPLVAIGLNLQDKIFLPKLKGV